MTRLLAHTEKTLPAAWYYDPAQFERELEALWYRDWLCVGRQEDVPRPGDFFQTEIGTQRLIVTRNRAGRLKVFHNTCRHRGSLLCESKRGHFANGRIVCPYHSWTYSTDGSLMATPARLESRGFRLQDYSLYEVHCDTWGGFVFVNLAEVPAAPLRESLGEEADVLESWPLADLVSVQQEKKQLACNWKLFWENYSECFTARGCTRSFAASCRFTARRSSRAAICRIGRASTTTMMEGREWRQARQPGPSTGNRPFRPWRGSMMNGERTAWPSPHSPPACSWSGIPITFAACDYCRPGRKVWS